MILKDNHFFLTSAADVKELVQPLTSLGITYFSYGRHYNDGGRIWLCNAPHIVVNYYKNKLYRMGNTENHPSHYQAQTVLWSTLPKQKVFEISKQLNVDNGLFTIRPEKDYCEFFGFATTRDNYQIINTYLTHIDVLYRYETFFKEKAMKLIHRAEENKIMLPFYDNTIPTVKSINSNFDMKVKSSRLLSQRQYACAELLLQGKTIKEIAKELTLSPRTVETYLNNLKSKFHCENKASLIVKLMKVLA